MPQIADLCRQGKLTPLFPYHLYISKPCWHEEDGRPRYAPSDTQKFDGYLTHDHLISLIDGYTDSLSLTAAAAHVGDDMEILLFDSHQRDPEDTTPHPFMVRLENILLAADQVHRCIDDMKAEHARDNAQLGDNTARSYEITIGLLLELLTTSKGCDKNGNPNPPQYNKAAIVTAIVDQDITGQRKTTIGERFTSSAIKLKDARKAK